MRSQFHGGRWWQPGRRHFAIAIDFDGTIVEHEYPKIGAFLPNAIATLLECQRRGATLLLWTVRDGRELTEAVAACASKGLKFSGVNRNPRWHGQSPKILFDLCVDDRAIGVPLRGGNVDWCETLRAELFARIGEAMRGAGR